MVCMSKGHLVQDHEWKCWRHGFKACCFPCTNTKDSNFGCFDQSKNMDDHFVRQNHALLMIFLVNWFIFSFNFVQSFPLCQTKSPLCQTKHPICWTESMLVQISNIGSFLQLHSTFSKLNSFRHLTQRGQQSPRAPCRPPYTVQMFQPFSTPCHQTHGIERFLMYDSSVRWCVVRKKIGTK